MRFLIRLFVTTLLMSAAVVAAAEPMPVIYSTDLFHPPDDPDDHVDLATLFAIPELDIRGIILDLGQQQSKNSGTIPVKQMIALTGRQVQVANGLVNPLRYPEDKALDQFAHSHAGVELMLRILRESSVPVAIITTGSLRDVAAAYNREPELFRAKVGRIYVNAGNAGGGSLHWNPRLDPLAYLRIMRSGLPVYWAPCFYGPETLSDLAEGLLATKPHQSYWRFQQEEIYNGAPSEVQNFFLYALSGKIPSLEDPISSLYKPVDAALREKFYRQTRHMWSTVTLYHAVGRQMYRKGNDWAALTGPVDGYAPSPLFEFVPASVSIDDNLKGTVRTDKQDGALRVLQIDDPESYRQAMITSLARLLREFPMARTNAGRPQ